MRFCTYGSSRSAWQAAASGPCDELLAASAAAKLTTVLCDGDFEVRCAAVGALGCALSAEGAASLAERCVPHLVPALADVDEDVRAAAAFALGQCGAAAIPVLGALVASLADLHCEVRSAVVRAFGLLSAQGAVDGVAEAVAALLRHASPPVRLSAVEALAALGSEAVPVLHKLAGAMEDDSAL